MKKRMLTIIMMAVLVLYANSTLADVAVVTNVRPIPEPTNMLLMGAGFIGLVVIGRKKIFKK